MRTIHKFPVEGERFDLPLAHNARPLAFQRQRENLCLWVETDPDERQIGTDMAQEYLETKVLLRALEEDEVGLVAAISALLPGERRALRDACQKVIRELDIAELPRLRHAEGPDGPSS